MRPFHLSLLFVFFASPVFGEQHKETDEEEIIIADRRVDLKKHPVFFVDAPSNVAGEILSAVRIAIEDNPEWCFGRMKVGGLCNERSFRSFVAVTGDGTQLLSGYACGDSVGVPYLKYYREDLVGEWPCLRVDWLPEERVFDIYPEGAP